MIELERLRSKVIEVIAHTKEVCGETSRMGYHDAMFRGDGNVAFYEAAAKDTVHFGTMIKILRDYGWDTRQIMSELLSCFDVPPEIVNARMIPLHYDT